MNEITEKLIRQAAAGNQGAITELYELTYSSVYKTVRAMVQDEDTVLDIVQDSYIKGFQSLDQLDEAENFRAWMKRIATNKAKDHLKKRKPILFSEMANEDGEEIDFEDDCLDHCPEEVLDRQETTRLMNEILGTLSEEQRLVIGMFYYEEMSVREIAEVLGCSENTVKSRLNYGRKKVEVKVRELEKKGTKLYSLAPLPFLLWLFRMDAQAAEMPSLAVWDAVTTACANPTSSAAAGAGTQTAAPAGGKTAAKAGARTAAKTGAKAAAKTAAKTGGKALAAKIIAGVLAVGVVGGGAAVAVTSLTQEKDEIPSISTEAWEENRAGNPDLTLPAETETTEPTSPAISSPDVAYSTVMDSYLSALNMDSEAYLAAYEADALDGIHNGDHQAIRYYHMYHSQSFFTARMDLDGNGVDELLVGVGYGGEPQSGEIVDLYSFDGDRAVQLIDVPSLGDRSHLWLLADHTLSFLSSSGAADNYYDSYKVQGCELVSVAPSDAPEIQPNWQFLGGQEPPTAEAAYTEVVSEMISACAEDDDAWVYGGAGDSYRFANSEAMFFYHMIGSQGPRDSFFMAMADLDGNGTQELFIGTGADAASAYAIGVYGFNGREAVSLSDGMLFEILTDGTILLTGNGASVERVTQLGPDGYTLVDVDNDIALGSDLYFQSFVAHGGKLSLNWEPLSAAAITASSGASFDTILADIQNAVNTVPLDAYRHNWDEYDSQYPNLGEGVLRRVVDRESGAYTLGIWTTLYDADRDGQKELCVGTGVSAGRPITTIAIYKQNGGVITGDALALCPLPEGLDDAGMPLAGWVYFCG